MYIVIKAFAFRGKVYRMGDVVKLEDKDLPLWENLIKKGFIASFDSINESDPMHKRAMIFYRKKNNVKPKKVEIKEKEKVEENMVKTILPDKPEEMEKTNEPEESKEIVDKPAETPDKPQEKPKRRRKRKEEAK